MEYMDRYRIYGYIFLNILTYVYVEYMDIWIQLSLLFPQLWLVQCGKMYQHIKLKIFLGTKLQYMNPTKHSSNSTQFIRISICLSLPLLLLRSFFNIFDASYWKSTDFEVLQYELLFVFCLSSLFQSSWIVLGKWSSGNIW